MSKGAGALRHLMVPIRVEALAMGLAVEDQRKKAPQWARLAPDYSRLATDWLRGDELRKTLLDPSQNSAPLAQGVHLHFRLPTALTHGVAARKDDAAKAKLDFPRVPNRWLVQRYRKQDDGTWAARMWVVRSDAQNANEAPGAVLPVSGAANAGKSMRLEAFGGFEEIPPGSTPILDLGDTPSRIPLTAVTGGDAGFSAHYPSCHGMLGFHDPLEDGNEPIDKATLTYLVSGWYSAEADDPWRQLLAHADTPDRKDGPTGLAKIAEWMAEHRLRYLFGDKSDLSQLPSALLCYGWVRNLDWKRGRDYWLHEEDEAVRGDFLAFDDPAKYSIEIGNTLAEALAARLPRQGKTDPSLFEDVVTGFQGGLLAQGLAPADIDAELHRLSFVPLPSGTLWSVEAERVNSTPRDQADAARSPGVLPEILHDKLDALNASQRLNNRLKRQCSDYEWELYALWHRLIDAQRKNSPGQEKLAQLIGAVTTFLDGYSGLPVVIAARAALTRAMEELDAAIAKPAAGPNAVRYVKVEMQAPPFYLPNDPVLIVSGPALQPYGSDSYEDVTPCRITGEELVDIQRPKARGKLRKAPAAEPFDTAHLTDLERFAPWARRLLREMWLIDSIGTPDGGKGAMVGIFGGGPSAAKLPLNPALLPNLGISDWKYNPWIPQYLVWQAAWQTEYAAGSLPTTQITGRWKLDGEPPPDATELWTYRRRADFLPQSGELKSTGGSTTIRGYAILSRPALQTGGQTPILAPDESGSTDTGISATLREIHGRLWPLIAVRPTASHVVGGYHNALIMRHFGDQLPPLRWSDQGHWKSENAHTIEANIPDRFAYSPDLGKPFFPIRAGRFDITGLWIVDAFGQKVRIPGIDGGQDERVKQSGRLKADSGSGAFALRPRFAQAMRLVFAPEPAGNPPAVAPASSSICGWIVCNRLEQSMTLYSADGRLLGAMQRRFNPPAGESLYYWVPAPGADTPPGISNPHLQDFHDFVLSLTIDQGRSFSELIGRGITATEQRTPDSDQTVSLLAGRPLALVRASLAFETAGVPALNEKTSWTKPISKPPLADLLAATLGDSKPGDCEALDTGGFENVDWPVLLGDGESPADGLIGFFKGEPGAARPFYAARGLGLRAEAPGILKARQDLALNCRGRVRLTLLMDPFARVHATTGVLPRVSLELSARDAAMARRAWEVFFQTAPVLGAGTTPRIPKPSDDYGEWSWVCRPAVTGWTTDSNLVSASDRESDAILWPTVSEGWLKLRIAPVRILEFWKKSDGENPVLAWTVRGAETVELFRLSGEGLQTRTSEGPRPLPAAMGECRVTVRPDSVFELVARDEMGNHDAKRIEIEPERGDRHD